MYNSQLKKVQTWDVLELAAQRKKSRKSSMIDDLVIWTGCHARDASRAIERELETGNLSAGATIHFPTLAEQGKQWLLDNRG